MKQTLEEQTVVSQAAHACVDEAKRAADAALVGQRPWIDARLRGREPPTKRGAGDVHVSYEVRFHNVGKTPALNVRSANSFRRFDMMAGHDDYIEAVMASARVSQDRRPVIFPGENVFGTGYSGPESSHDTLYVGIIYEFVGSSEEHFSVVRSGLFIIWMQMFPPKPSILKCIEGQLHTAFERQFAWVDASAELRALKTIAAATAARAHLT